MTKSAYVLTHWAGTGTFKTTQPIDDSYRPGIADDYPLLAYQDVTGHPSVNIPPTPNLFIALVSVDDATAALVQADAKYHFLTRDQWKIVPGAPAFTAFSNWLVTKSGHTLAQVQVVVGATVAGRVWGQILTDLIAWMQTRPHG